MTAPSFFISYSHDDKALASALADALRARGCAVWRDEDELHVGDSLATRIPEAVLEVEYFVVLVSESAKGSNWCQKELSLAVTDGLKQGRVKVLPLRVGEVEMPAAISDLLYVEVDADTVDQAADKLVAAARRAPQPGASRVQPARSPAAGGAAQEFEPIKITGVVTEAVGRPRNDGTRGSGLYSVPLKLSRRPSHLWSQAFVETWNHPPRFTTMHRPGIARVSGDTIVLDGTTLDEIEQYHAETLRHVIPRVNEMVAETEQRQRAQAEREAAARRAHESHVDDAARRLRFD